MLIALFIALQIADVALTLVILGRGGRELNPVAVWCMAKLGRLGGLVALKIPVVGVVLWAATVVPWMLWAGCALYVAVVAWNGFQLAKIIRNATRVL